MKVKSKKHIHGNHLSKPEWTSSQEDRAWSKALAKVEELGRILSSSTLTKSTVDTVVATTVGAMAVLEKLLPSSTVQSLRQNSKKYLRVADAESLADFLKLAKQVYRKIHSHAPKRGRRPEEINAFMCLLRLSTEASSEPTQAEMVKTLMALNLSKNTAYKYAKLYLLSLRWDRNYTQFTQAERRWFIKNKGIASWSNLFWMSGYLHYKRQLDERGGSELF